MPNLGKRLGKTCCRNRRMNSNASTVIFRQRFEPLRRYEKVALPSSHATILRSLMATRKTYGARYFKEAWPSPTAWE